MKGAITGDIIGSRYEWNNIKTKKFPLFGKGCFPTDDSMMTLAVASAIMKTKKDGSDLGENTVFYMKKYGRKYPDAGYGGHFYGWLFSEDSAPYNSWGNGSAMRVSPCGFAAKSLEEAESFAETTAAVTHNHPEGIKGAKATAAAIFLAKSGKSKEEIKEYILEKYYDIDFTLDEIRADYRFDVSCQGSVPQALEAFFESTGFEDCIRNAVSIGGDSDTVAAIAGGVAEAYYSVPDEIFAMASEYMDDFQKQIVYDFEKSL